MDLFSNNFIPVENGLNTVRVIGPTLICNLLHGYRKKCRGQIDADFSCVDLLECKTMQCTMIEKAQEFTSRPRNWPFRTFFVYQI